MDRRTDVQISKVSRQVRPVDRLVHPRRVRSDAADEPSRAPYGVEDRVTLSPEGRAMAMRQRAALPSGSVSQPLTYGPGGPALPPPLSLPYQTESESES